MPGTLYLVPAPLDFGCREQGALTQCMPEATLRIAAGLQFWICENAKSARAYLKRIDATHPLAVPLQSMHLTELPRTVHKKGDHQGQFDARPLLQAALEGHSMGLLSEAGMPAVADPGSSVVRAAHDLSITVVPLVGPVSLLLALAASGLNGQQFAFVGYVPTDPLERVQTIRALETQALKYAQTQIFIETPYRNRALLEALLTTLKPDTRLAISSGLLLSTGHSKSAPVREWRKESWTISNDVPTVFSIGK